MYELNNYISLRNYGSSKKLEIKLKQDKGIGKEYICMYDVLKGNKRNEGIKDAMVSVRMLLRALNNGFQFN